MISRKEREILDVRDKIIGITTRIVIMISGLTKVGMIVKRKCRIFLGLSRYLHSKYTFTGQSVKRNVTIRGTVDPKFLDINIRFM